VTRNLTNFGRILRQSDRLALSGIWKDTASEIGWVVEKGGMNRIIFERKYVASTQYILSLAMDS
jgi:hypothetical protein